MIGAWGEKLHRAAARTGRELVYRARSTVSGKTLLDAPIGPPIFIVGCGHSGTTVLLSILSAHSRIYSVPYETEFLRMRNWEIQRFVGQFNKEAVAAGKTRWVEKTPRHIRFLKKLQHFFPEAKVILMVRDGQDVACSIRDRTGSFETGVQRWVQDNTAGETFWNNPHVRMSKYEDLVASPAAELTAMMDFLGERLEPAMLEHHRGSFRFYGSMHKMEAYKEAIDLQSQKPESVSGNSHRLYRSWQVTQPIFDGRGRWQEQITPEEKALFKELAGDKLIRYGYERDFAW